MTWIRSNARPLLGLLIVIVAVLGAIFITAATPPRTPTAHVVKLIPVAYRAPSTGGGISVPHYFVRALRHHAWCGAPTTIAKRGIHGVFRQRFQHCEMAIGPVKVYGLPAPPPLPERTVIGAVVGGTPTPKPPVPASPVPTATRPAPFPTNATEPPTTIPPARQPTSTAVSAPSSDPVSYELSLMNATRAQYGLPPYSLDTVQSNGTASCGGSVGHSQDMAASGTIWHQNAQYPGESFPNNFCSQGFTALGQNVGFAGGYSVLGALDVIHQSMLQEPYTPGCQGNHHCSILSPTYRRVGIGVYTSGTSTYLTVDFESP